MLLKRYGPALQSVVPEFKAEALNEITFVRDGAFSIPVERFEALYEPVREAALAPATDAAVQKDAEESLLRVLEKAIEGERQRLEDGHVLLIENAAGVDWPKTRERRQDVIVDGENRFHFHWRVEPPLRLGVHRRRP